MTSKERPQFPMTDSPGAAGDPTHSIASRAGILVQEDLVWLMKRVEGHASVGLDPISPVGKLTIPYAGSERRRGGLHHLSEEER